MPKRVVMLRFRADAMPEQIKTFIGQLQAFADSIPYKIWMHSGLHVPLAGEKALDVRAPDVTTPSFMAVWEFPDRAALEAFVEDPIHRAFASEIARKIVEHRFVANIL